MMKAWLLASIIALAGCTSSYDAVRLSSSGEYRGVDPHTKIGVPFSLTKPEFTIKRIEGSDPERFDIAIAYVPDPEQRYALNINPTWLAKIDFNIAIGEAGGLSSSSADITDQSLPFATAVIKLAASVAKVAMASPMPRASGTPACLNNSGLGAIAKCAIADSYANRPVCPPGAGQEIEARLAHAIAADKDDKGGVLDTLFVRSTAEVGCFNDAAVQLDTAVKADIQALTDAFQNEGEANDGPLLPHNAAKPAAALFAGAKTFLTKLIEERDVISARKLVYATQLAAQGKGQYLGKLLKMDPPSAADASLLDQVLDKIGFKKGAGAEPIVAITNGTKVQKALAGVDDLTPGQWRARYVPVLQYEQAEAERAALTADTPAEARRQTAIASDRRRKLASMVNMSAEYSRLEKLDAVLDAVPAFSASDKQSRIEQYQGYGKEAADIRAELATRLTAAVTAEKAAKKEVILPVSLPWVSRACIDESTSLKGWIYTAGAEAADYVIVLRNARGDIVPPANQADTGAAMEMLPSECGS